MDLGLVGTGPAAAAIEAAWSDVDGRVVSLEPDDLREGTDIPSTGAVVATSGSPVFGAADDLFGRYVTVEIGGVGGVPRPEIDASVAAIGPDSGCHDCLRTRIRSHLEADGDVTPSGDRSAVRFAGAAAGRRLLAALGGNAAWGTLIEIPGRERSFLPVPGCDCTERESRDSAFDLDYRSVDLDDALSRAEQAVDDRVGLLAEVGERESFPVPYYVTVTADTTGFSDVQAAEFAAGVDLDWDRSFMKALGEGLERYCAGVYRSASLRNAPAAAVENPVLPREFVLPDDRELPDVDAPISWVEGIDLSERDRVQLPAEFVLYPPPARQFRPAITTGLGLGNSTIEAVLSGLYEVIERDATMIGWYSTFEPLGLSVEDPVFDRLRKRASAESLSVTPLLVTQDVDVPVVAAAVHREDEALEGDPWPAFAVGSGASMDPIAAARSALSEALQNWMELDAMGEAAARKEKAAIGRYGRFPPAAREFVDVGTTVEAESIVDARSREDEALEGRTELDAVLERLADVDLSAYAARTTTQDVERLGFEAVRVVVPDAQPLFTGDPYFGDRAESVPRSMGFEPQLDREYHPYP